jgi:transposase-like protein
MVKSKFTSAEKSRIILEFLNTNITTAELCRKHNITPQTYYLWRDKFIAGGKASLNGTANGDVCKNLQKENNSLKRLIGELTITNDILKKTLEGHKR